MVEDEDDIADFLVRGLEEDGFVVSRAGDARSALRALAGARWDAVVLDRRMPDGDGVEVLRRFRASDHTTPVLVVTARGDVRDRVEGLDAGADDYLCKPFAFSELLARLRALERRRAAPGDVVLWYGDVRVDLATHRAERRGVPLGLTAKEETLLALFLRRPDEVLSRARIHDEVWGAGTPPSNTLEVHVAELRKKLEAHGPRLIHTRRTRGYVFGVLPAADRS